MAFVVPCVGEYGAVIEAGAIKVAVKGAIISIHSSTPPNGGEILKILVNLQGVTGGDGIFAWYIVRVVRGVCYQKGAQPATRQGWESDAPVGNPMM